MFSGKKILITGGTGSLGTALTKKLLDSDVDTIRIFSRDEAKQNDMRKLLTDTRLRFLIGDIRDKERISRALEDIDIVIHTAALKQVPVTEYNPLEAVKTNVYGTQNLIESCLDREVETVLGVGTDKAVSPFNTYGATKFLMERLFLSSNFYKGSHKTKFLCVRYGNVLGSRGSVVPLFVNQILQKQKITITDSSMTRFNITMTEALDLIYRALENGQGGEVFIPKLKAYNLGILKDTIFELMNTSSDVDTISVRLGEKFHESLISDDEIRHAYESEHDYILLENPQNYDFKKHPLQESQLHERYSSDKVSLLEKDELKDILLKEKLVPI